MQVRSDSHLHLSVAKTNTAALRSTPAHTNVLLLHVIEEKTDELFHSRAGRDKGHQINGGSITADAASPVVVLRRHILFQRGRERNEGLLPL